MKNIRREEFYDKRCISDYFRTADRRYSKRGYEDEPIEVVTPASYFYKNGKHYLIYEEVTEGFPGVTKNKIKVTDPNTIEILKSGNVNTHMLFCKGKDSMTSYNTPYGKMLVGINRTEVQVEETENFIRILIEYGLDVNHHPNYNWRSEL